MALETYGFHWDDQSHSHNLWLWRLKYFTGMNNLPSLIYGCFHPLQYFRPSHPLNISCTVCRESNHNWYQIVPVYAYSTYVRLL
jgi:hypothetical protein